MVKTEDNEPIAVSHRLSQTPAMTAYAQVDPVIYAWAQATVGKLFTGREDRPARFAYLRGTRPFEYFQISIEPPRHGRTVVSARSIVTDDASEFEQFWEGETATLSGMLEEATEEVRRWMNRSPGRRPTKCNKL